MASCDDNIYRLTRFVFVINLIAHHKRPHFWPETTLNHRVIVERYSFPYEIVGGSIPTVKSSLYLMEETNYVGRKPRAHPP